MIKEMISKIKFKVEPNAPGLLLGAGITAGIACAVEACIATVEAIDILDEAKEQLEEIDEALENGFFEDRDYSEADVKRDRTVYCIQTGLKIAKVYSWPAMIGVFAIGAVLQSNRILNRRYAGLVATYNVLDETFSDYRRRVIEDVGIRKDTEYLYGIKEVEVEETYTDKKGNEKTKKKTITVCDSDKPSLYSFFYDELCDGWDENAEYSRMNLEIKQNYLTDKLKSQGYLFYNDMRKEFGLPPTDYGQDVGWIYDPRNPNWHGDGAVDLRVVGTFERPNTRYINGYESVALLEPNVDGNIRAEFRRIITSGNR